MFFLLLGISMLAITAVAQEAIPKQINGGVLNGKAVSLIKPPYPAELKAAGVAGTVYVRVVIDESGTVVSAVASSEPLKVKRSEGDQIIEVEVPPADPALREAAEKAALESRFTPTLLSGQPVRVAGTIVYNFVADKSIDDSADVGKAEVDVLNGKAISMPRPAYPAAARAVNAEGAVTVKVTVDEGGEVISAAAVSGHPLLRAAAVAAARQAKFSPTIVDGRTAKVSGYLTYNFVAPRKDSN